MASLPLLSSPIYYQCQDEEKKDELIYYQERLKYQEIKEGMQLLKSCDEHDLNSSFHPPDAILSHLARIVYKKEISGELTANNLTEWKLISYGINDDDNYFGAAFYNKKTNQLVISHQGTKFFKDFVTDAQGVLRGQLTSQIRSACTFCAIVLKNLNNKKVHVSFTGHSLGAWLAQITTFTCEYLQLNKKKEFKEKSTNRNYNIHTVVFDSPGCYEMLCSISNSYFPKYQNEADYLITNLDITIYFNMPNFINSVNSHHHIGRLLQINKEDEKIQYSSWADTSTHKMKRFVEMLNSENSKVLTVLNWPSFSVPEKTNKKTRKGPSSYLLSTEVFKLAAYLTKKFFFAENELKACINKFNECSKKGHFDFTLEMNDKKISYKVENYDKNTQRVSAFSFNELNFLKFWEKFEKTNLTKEKFHERFQNISMPKFEITKENEKEIIRSGSEENLRKIVNYVKNLYCNEPEIHEIVKTESGKIPELYRSYYEFYSNNYIEKFPEYKNVNFTDTIELRQFLDSDKKIFCLTTKQNTMNEIFRIQKLLHSYEKSEQCYFNLVELNELKRHTNVSKIFQNKDITIDKYLIIDCSQENVNTDILKELINDSHTCQNNKKLILVSNKNLRGYDTSKWAKKNKISFELKDFDEESKEKLLNTQIEISSFDNKKLNLLEFFGQTVNDFFEKQKHVIEYLIKKELKIPDLCSENIVNFDAVKIRILKVYEDIKNKKFKQFFEQTVNDRIFYAISGGSGKNLKERSGLEMNVNAVEINGDPENFYEYCREINETLKNIDKFKIYWLHLPTDPNLVEIREVFVSDLYINRCFYPQILIQSELFEKVSPSAMYVTAERKLIEDLEKVMQKKQTPFEFTLKIKESLEAPSNDVCTINDKWMADFNTKFGFANGHTIKVEKISQNYKFIWKSSRSPVNEIRNLAITDYFVEKTESQLMENENNLVIIADEPGMGKSTTLLNIATNMKNKWIIWISLISVRAEIPELSPKPNINHIVKFFQTANNNLSDPLIESMLKYSLKKNNSVPIVFFFDGFDEIEDETAKKNIMQIFKFIKNETNAKLWITTRDWAKNDLENEFSTFTIKMKEITDEEQLNLVTNIWESRLMSLKGDQSQFKIIARELLYQVLKVLIFDRGLTKLKQKEVKEKTDKILDQIKNCPNLNKMRRGLLNELIENDQLLDSQPNSALNLLYSEETIEVLKEIRAFLLNFRWYYDSNSRNDRILFAYNYLQKKQMEGRNDLLINDILDVLKKIYSHLTKYKDKDKDKNSSFIGIPMQLRMIADIAQPKLAEDISGVLFRNFYNLYKEFILKKIKIYFREKLGRKEDSVYEQALINKHESLGFQLLFPKETKLLLDPDEKLDMGNDENQLEIRQLNDIGLAQFGSRNSRLKRFVHYSLAEFCATGKILKFLKRMENGEWICKKMENLIEAEILRDAKYNAIRRFFNDFLQDNTMSMFHFLRKNETIQGGPYTTPLHTAVNENNEQLAKVLLNSYVFKNESYRNDDNNQDRLCLASLLYTAVQSGSSYEIIRKIMNVKPRKGFWKITHEDDPNSDLYVLFSHKYGLPLMMISIENSKYEIIEDKSKICEFLKKGQLSSITTSNLKLLLEKVISTSDPDIFRIITTKELHSYRKLMQEDIDWSGEMLFSGFRYGPYGYKIVKNLLDLGANVNYARNDKTLFQEALSYGSDSDCDVAEFIIDRHDFDISAVKETIPILISNARHWDRIPMISKLLEKGVYADDFKDKLNLTEIGIAVLSNDCNKVSQLIKNADINVNETIAGYTLLQVAIMNNRDDIITELLTNEEIKKDIDNEFSYRHFNMYKTTPLQYAILKGFKKVAATLLEHGANVNIAGSYSKYTPLHAAAEVGDAEMAKKLIKKGSDINAKATILQNFIFTPILTAAYFSKWDVVLLLIENGADSSGEILVDELTGRIPDTVLGSPFQKYETVKSLAEAAGQTKILEMLHNVASQSDIDEKH